MEGGEIRKHVFRRLRRRAPSGIPETVAGRPRTGSTPGASSLAAPSCRRTGRRPAQGGASRQGTGRPGGTCRQDRGDGGPLQWLVRLGNLSGGASGADWLLEEIGNSGAMAVIPARRHRTKPRDHDREMYRWRHRTGNVLARIREFRAVATRCDRTDAGFAAAIHLVSGVVAAT